MMPCLFFMLIRILRQNSATILKDVKYAKPCSSTIRNTIHNLFMLNCTTVVVFPLPFRFALITFIDLSRLLGLEVRQLPTKSSSFFTHIFVS